MTLVSMMFNFPYSIPKFQKDLFYRIVENTIFYKYDLPIQLLLFFGQNTNRSHEVIPYVK